MKYEDVLSMVDEIGLPYAYDHFAEGEVPDTPYVVFLFPASDNFSADGRVYCKINELNIEMYSDIKDPESEELIEAVLDEHGLFYQKTETWIDEEKLYEVLYEMEV